LKKVKEQIFLINEKNCKQHDFIHKMFPGLEGWTIMDENIPKIQKVFWA